MLTKDDIKDSVKSIFAQLKLSYQLKSEANVTDSVEGYSTPNAFLKKAAFALKFKIKNKNSHLTPVKKTSIFFK